MKQRELSIAKITRPRLASVYERTRLFKLLDQCREKPVTWISGPRIPAALLAACGGGGGGGGTGGGPGAPVVSLAYDIKELQFSWDAVPNAIHYRLLENPDGISGYSQVGSDITATSVHYTIFLPARINARYIIAACNSSGCTNSIIIQPADQVVPAIGYLKGSNNEAGDNFGYSVALSLSGDGSTLAVGAVNEFGSTTGINSIPNNTAQAAGAIYVFVRASGMWSQQAYVKASNTGVDDNFGRAVALAADANTLAVGALSEASSATGIGGDQTSNTAFHAGAVYLS